MWWWRRCASGCGWCVRNWEWWRGSVNVKQPCMLLNACSCILFVVCVPSHDYSSVACHNSSAVRTVTHRVWASTDEHTATHLTVRCRKYKAHTNMYIFSRHMHYCMSHLRRGSLADMIQRSAWELPHRFLEQQRFQQLAAYLVETRRGNFFKRTSPDKGFSKD